MGTVDLMTSDISLKEKHVRFTTISLNLISDMKGGIVGNYWVLGVLGGPEMSRLSSFSSLMTNAFKFILEQKCTSHLRESNLQSGF